MKIRSILMLSGMLVACMLTTSMCGKGDREETIPSGPPSEPPLCDYIEYREGDMPLLLTVPHDGDLDGEGLVERTTGNCIDWSTYSYYSDGRTRQLADNIEQSIIDLMGKRPYMVIMKAKRRYVEPNREVERAVPYDGSPTAEGSRMIEANKAVYESFHGTIDWVVAKIEEEYGAGLLLDIHGHGKAEYQNIEVGYMLTGPAVRAAADVLNTAYAEKASIYSLGKSNKAGVTLAELVKGEGSIGSLFEKYDLPAVPSHLTPQLYNGFYNVGYIINCHGSAALGAQTYSSGGAMDAIQLEFNTDARADANSAATGEAAARAIRDYMNFYYDF